MKTTTTILGVSTGVLLIGMVYVTYEYMKCSKAIKDSGYKIDPTTGKLVAATA
jgi:hypothetical protein